MEGPKRGASGTSTGLLMRSLFRDAFNCGLHHVGCGRRRECLWDLPPGGAMFIPVVPLTLPPGQCRRVDLRVLSKPEHAALMSNLAVGKPRANENTCHGWHTRSFRPPR